MLNQNMFKIFYQFSIIKSISFIMLLEMFYDTIKKKKKFLLAHILKTKRYPNLFLTKEI